jgi:4-alpha-glucanotransferase
VRAYTGVAPGEPVVWPLIRTAVTSVADTCIFPLQDILSLGSEARMNTPAGEGDNWCWRFAPGALRAEDAARLAELTEVADRDAPPAAEGANPAGAGPTAAG